MQQSKYKFYGLGLLITLVTFFVASVSFDIGERIVENIKIQGINVGGLKPEVAISKLKQLAEKPIIKLNYKENIYYIYPEDIDYKYNYQASIEQVYQVGRRPVENIYQRYVDIYYTRQEGRNYQLASEYNKKLLDTKIQAIIAQIQKAPQNASFIGSPASGKLEIEQPGVLADAYGLYYQIIAALELGAEKNLQIETVQLPPAVYAQDLNKFKRLLGKVSFATETESLEQISYLDGKIWRQNTALSWQTEVSQGQDDKKSITPDLYKLNSGAMLQNFVQLCRQLELQIERVSQNEQGEVIVQNKSLDFLVRNDSKTDIYIACYQQQGRIYLEFWGKN